MQNHTARSLLARGVDLWRASACSRMTTSSRALLVDDVAASADEELRKMQSKLLYRSKQRGFLELDLLMGLWAEREIPHMNMKQLKDLEIVLHQENPDLFKWLTGQLEPPQEMQQNATFQALKASASETLSQRSPAASRAAPGTDWVRGWDDNWKKSNTEPSAHQ